MIKYNIFLFKTPVFILTFSLTGFENMTINLTEQTSITWSTEETTLEDQTLLFVR